MFSGQFNEFKKQDKQYKNSDHNGESKFYGMSAINKGSYNRIEESHSNGLNHGNKYVVKSSLKIANNADDGKE